jgi:hypothetical protein
MTTPPHFPNRQIAEPPATIQPTVGYASIIAPMPSGWTAVTDHRIQTLEADIDRLTRERDALLSALKHAQAECRAWRDNYSYLPVAWTGHPVTVAMQAHDAACPGWDSQ